MPTESLEATGWTPQLLCSPIQHPRWLQETSPLSLRDGDIARGKAAACSEHSGSGTQRCLVTGDYSTPHLYSHPSMPGA